jgi:hypothetical protein
VVSTGAMKALFCEMIFVVSSESANQLMEMTDIIDAWIKAVIDGSDFGCL